MKKPFYFSTIFKRFLSFDLENKNSSNSFYRSTNYLQVKVSAANGRIICRLKFNLPIQDLFADQSSICRWKNYLQIKEPSAYQRMICNWFATDFQLQLTDCNCNLQLMGAPVELYYCYYTQTDITDK